MPDLAVVETQIQLQLFEAKVADFAARVSSFDVPIDRQLAPGECVTLRVEAECVGAALKSLREGEPWTALYVLKQVSVEILGAE